MPHPANKGATANEIHNVYEPPPALPEQWSARHYHESVDHDDRAAISRYLGYRYAKPVALIPLSPVDPLREDARSVATAACFPAC